MRKFLLGGAFATALLVSGCAGGMSDNPNAAALSISVNTAGIRCTKMSPEITISGTPAGTTNYYFHLQDLNAPGWNHGGGTVPAASDGVIKAGSIGGGYNGPCPPDGTHTYVFTVKAMDASGSVLAAGKQSIDM